MSHVKMAIRHTPKAVITVEYVPCSAWVIGPRSKTPGRLVFMQFVVSSSTCRDDDVTPVLLHSSLSAR